jgi:hypothetical protein
MTSAAADLAAIGSNVNAAHMVAAARTTSVIPAAADEVSTGIAHLFSQHAASYQALAGQAAAFQEQFAQHLAASAGSFAHAEAANTWLLQDAIAFLNKVAETPPQPLDLSNIAATPPYQLVADALFLFLLPVVIPEFAVVALGAILIAPLLLPLALLAI